MLRFSDAQPVLGHVDPHDCFPKRAVKAEEAVFQSIDGFGRKRGINRIVSLGDTAFPELGRALSKVLATEIRLFDPKAFVQSEGAGLELHSDPVVVVTWQIKGSKAWRVYDPALMPNDMIALRRAQDTPVAAQLLSEFYSALPVENALEFILHRGDFLVIPAFAPHETRSFDDGMSVSLTLGLATSGPFT